MNRIIKYLITSGLAIFISLKLIAQYKPTKKLVNTKSTLITNQNSKVKTYKITAQKNDNQIFGYVTMEAVDTNTQKKNIKNKK